MNSELAKSIEKLLYFWPTADRSADKWLELHELMVELSYQYHKEAYKEESSA